MTVVELIETLKEFDPDAEVIIYDSHKNWVILTSDDMNIGTSPLQDCKPEDRDKLLFIRHR